MRWRMLIGVASVIVMLFAASLAPVNAAMSVRGSTSTVATSARTARSSQAEQNAAPPAPVIGVPVSETPDPNLPLNAERPAPVIGEPVSEAPDPNRPQDVNQPEETNTSSRAIRR